MKRVVFLLLCALFLCSGVSRAADPDRFDGTWDTVLSCSNTDGALGYSFKFPSIVKDSTLHGEKGTKGQPGWLQIQGRSNLTAPLSSTRTASSEPPRPRSDIVPQEQSTATTLTQSLPIRKAPESV
jgi:hypothetical protein